MFARRIDEWYECEARDPTRASERRDGPSFRPPEQIITKPRLTLAAFWLLFGVFVLAGLTGESVLNIARKAVPYVLSMLVVVLLLAFVPALSLWSL